MKQTQLSQSEIQDLVFVDALLKSITGLSLEDIPNYKKSDMIKQSVDIYTNYIIGYFKENFEPKDILRIKQVLKEGSVSIFDKFPDLQVKFDEAYESFINYLK